RVRHPEAARVSRTHLRQTRTLVAGRAGVRSGDPSSPQTHDVRCAAMRRSRQGAASSSPSHSPSMLKSTISRRRFQLTMKYVHAVAAVLRRVLAGTLSCRDCRLLFCVSAAEPIALAALRCGSIRGARRALAWLRPLALAFSGRPSEARVIRALAARGRWLGGGSTCLGRALV